MPDHRLPKRLFYGELQQGKRSHGGQKKRFKDTLKYILESVCYHPRLLGTNRHGSGQVAFLRAQRLQDMRGKQLQQSKGGKPGKPEPTILRMTSPSSPVPTANVPSVHGLALSTICALTRSSLNYPQMTTVVLVDSTDEHDMQ